MEYEVVPKAFNKMKVVALRCATAAGEIAHGTDVNFDDFSDRSKPSYAAEEDCYIARVQINHFPNGGADTWEILALVSFTDSRDEAMREGGQGIIELSQIHLQKATNERYVGETGDGFQKDSKFYGMKGIKIDKDDRIYLAGSAANLDSANDYGYTCIAYVWILEKG